MKLGRSTLSALLASTLVAAPVIAQAAPAASRASAEVEGEGQFLGGVSTLGAVFFVVVVVVAGYLAFVEDEDEDLPTSP